MCVHLRRCGYKRGTALDPDSMSMSAADGYLQESVWLITHCLNRDSGQIKPDSALLRENKGFVMTQEMALKAVEAMARRWYYDHEKEGLNPFKLTKDKLLCIGRHAVWFDEKNRCKVHTAAVRSNDGYLYSTAQKMYGFFEAEEVRLIQTLPGHPHSRTPPTEAHGQPSAVAVPQTAPVSLDMVASLSPEALALAQNYEAAQRVHVALASYGGESQEARTDEEEVTWAKRPWAPSHPIGRALSAHVQRYID